MIDGLVIIDDVFENPDLVVEYAMKQKFYNASEHSNSKHVKINWKGERTLQINDIDNSYYQVLISHLINKVLKDKQFNNIYVKSEMYFHLLDKDYTYTNDCMHKDVNCQIAGVVYLTKNPSPKSGTIINKDNELIEVENVYNRFILYNSQYPHSALSGFGNSNDTSRLTLTLFINEFNISLV